MLTAPARPAYLLPSSFGLLASLSIYTLTPVSGGLVLFNFGQLIFTPAFREPPFNDPRSRSRNLFIPNPASERCAVNF